VLAPLVAANAARVLPLQAPASGVPWLLECCPASALKRLGLYQPYKGRGRVRAAQRAAILDALADHGLAPPPTALRRVITGQEAGDALDSTIAAWIAYRMVARRGALEPVPPGWPVMEGLVYTGFPVTARARASIP
jgi:hypothetical protein